MLISVSPFPPYQLVAKEPGLTGHLKLKWGTIEPWIQVQGNEWMLEERTENQILEVKRVK